eukprot:gene4874-5119_t
MLRKLAKHGYVQKPVVVITGPPATGKSTAIKAIVSMCGRSLHSTMAGDATQVTPVQVVFEAAAFTRGQVLVLDDSQGNLDKTDGYNLIHCAHDGSTSDDVDIERDVKPVVEACQTALGPERMRNAENAGLHLAATMLVVREAVGAEAAEQLKKWALLHWLPQLGASLSAAGDTAGLNWALTSVLEQQMLLCPDDPTTSVSAAVVLGLGIHQLNGTKHVCFPLDALLAKLPATDAAGGPALQRTSVLQLFKARPSLGSVRRQLRHDHWVPGTPPQKANARAYLTCIKMELLPEPLVCMVEDCIQQEGDVARASGHELDAAGS